MGMGNVCTYKGFLPYEFLLIPYIHLWMVFRLQSVSCRSTLKDKV